jgi:hypothetical protein
MSPIRPVNSFLLGPAPSQRVVMVSNGRQSYPLERMKHTRTDPAHGGIEFYVREGDAFKLENGKKLMIQYGFLREKFYVGLISIRGAEEWNALKEAVFNKFGGGAKPFINREEYLWVGKNVVMSLQYDENLKFGAYYIRSESMVKKMAQN